MNARSELSFQATTSIVCTTRHYLVHAAKIRTMANLICTRLGVGHYELALRFVGSTTIRRLNRDFRQIDKATDVLSFPQLEWAKPAAIGKAKKVPRRPLDLKSKPTDVLGDVIISLPDAATNAKRIGQPLAREVGFLLIHGILHLCGYDHLNSNDEKTMRQAQRVLMRSLNKTSGGKPLWTGSVKRRQQGRSHAN